VSVFTAKHKARDVPFMLGPQPRGLAASVSKDDAALPRDCQRSRRCWTVRCFLTSAGTRAPCMHSK
jgi:hypothetical protein